MNASDRLAQKIARLIREEGGPGRAASAEGGIETVQGIPFRDYMAMCLYDEEYGYYRSGSVRVGRSGDFYTSSAVGTVMGEMLAAYIARSSAACGLPANVMEWGGGTGRLAVQMMEAWRSRYPQFAEALSYVLVDGDPAHRAAAASAAAEAGFTRQVDVLPPEKAESALATGIPRVIVANELLDAFPVHRVIRVEGELWELGVAVRNDGRGFRYCRLEPGGAELAEALNADGITLQEGQETEIGLDGQAWLRRTLRTMKNGGLTILIDYGDTAGELNGPHRMQGTLLCYHKHTAHDDPFREPGGQDITAHVNFSACIRAAASEGWGTLFYGTQKDFLVACGILEELQDRYDPDPFSHAARRNRAIRQLLLSDGMSESFKVAVFRKT